MPDPSAPAPTARDHVAEDGPAGSGRLPFVVFLLALGTFLMCTTEYLIAGLLPQMAGDFDTSLAQAGLLITAFAIGMIIGAPSMALATLRLGPCSSPAAIWPLSATSRR
jgi:DHA1 family inner membrane transport protein